MKVAVNRYMSLLLIVRTDHKRKLYCTVFVWALDSELTTKVGSWLVRIYSLEVITPRLEIC